jgi:excisionase family DNA binding protein
MSPPFYPTGILVPKSSRRAPTPSERPEREPAPAEFPEVLSGRQAARFLGLSEDALYEHKDEIPHRRVGTRLLFSRTELLRWLGGRQP